MFRNYLAAALRNLMRNRFYAAINIIGLAVGFAAALLIALFVRDEFSYDRWLPDAAQTYILTTANAIAGRSPTSRFEGQPEVAHWLKIDFPDIKAIARVTAQQVGVRRGAIEAIETVRWADPDLFSILQVPSVAGDLEGALTQPDAAVLSRSMARKYFGKDDPIGETLEINRNHPMRVAAVMDDLPSNTHLAFDIVLSAKAAFSSLAEMDAAPPASASGGLRTAALIYARFAPGISAAAVNGALPDFVRKRMPLMVANGRNLQLAFMPIADIHLVPSAMGGPMKAGGDLSAVFAVAAVGGLIVLAAGMNFVNLMTARAARRAVEVGVRRVSGAWRRELILQFMGESLIYVGLGMAMAMILAAVLLPAFNSFLTRTIAFDYVRNPVLIASVLALVVLAGTLAGFYPAVVLTRIRPAAVLKGKVQKAAGSGLVRQALVIVQFAILIGLILSTGVIYRQTVYALGNGLRLDKDQVLLVYGACAPAFKDEVRRLAGVRAAACATSEPLGFQASIGPVILPTGEETVVSHASVDPGFFELYGLHPVAGRFFVEGRAADAAPADRTAPWQAPLVINEGAARKFGFATPAAAIGQTVVLRGAARRAQASEIIGVVPDFPLGSVREPIHDTVYYFDPARFGLMSIKLKGEQIPETLQAIDRLWERLGDRPAPIQREFLDEYQQRLYLNITREADLFAIFAATAAFIAGLGLFGLAVFTAEQRIKEIGIRKALGASRADVLRLLLWQFAKPVLLANIIAWPAGYIAMNRWLEGFAYHIDPEPWIFLGASAIALVIAILTMLGQALLVARAQPVVSLRYE